MVNIRRRSRFKTSAAKKETFKKPVFLPFYIFYPYYPHYDKCVKLKNKVRSYSA